MKRRALKRRALKRRAMNALVLGGAGHVGNAIVRALLARGHRVAVVGRRPRTPVNLARLPVTYRRGNDSDRAFLLDCTTGCDVIVDAAAPYPAYLPEGGIGRSAAAERALISSCQWRMRSLLDVAWRQRARLAHIGSFTTSAVGRRPLDMARARWVQKLHPYFAVKACMESMVLRAARAGLPAMVVNPSACLGPWDSKPRDLCTVPRLLAGEWMPSLARQINVIDVRDVAAVVSRALERSDSDLFGRAVVLGGHNLISDQLADRLCDLAHRPRPRRHPLPIDTAVVMAYAAERWHAALSMPRRWPVLAVMLMAEQRWLPESQEMARLGVSPHPLLHTLLDTIAWYRRLGYC